MEQKLALTLELLQQPTQEVYTWFTSLTTEETVEVCKHFITQMNDNPDYGVLKFMFNVVADLSKTYTKEELFLKVAANRGSGKLTFRDDMEKHPMFANTELAITYMMKAVTKFYKSNPTNKDIKQVAKNLFKVQYESGILGKDDWKDSDILQV